MTRSYRKGLNANCCQWPITAINYDRVVARISIKLCTWYHLVTLWEGYFVTLKIYKRSLNYVEGKPLTSHNRFIQPYRTLDTLFSEYYELLPTYMCMWMHTRVLYMCAYAQSSSLCNYMYMLAVSCMPQYHKCLNSHITALIIHTTLLKWSVAVSAAA